MNLAASLCVMPSNMAAITAMAAQCLLLPADSERSMGNLIKDSKVILLLTNSCHFTTF